MIFNIKKSLFLISVTLAAHLMAIPILIMLPWAFWAKSVLMVMVLVSLFWQWRHGVGRHPGRLKLEDDGTCLLAPGHEEKDMRFRIDSAHLHAGMLRLVLKGQGTFSRSLIIARDAVAPEVYRELRARILQRRLPVRNPDPASP